MKKFRILKVISVKKLEEYGACQTADFFKFVYLLTKAYPNVPLDKIIFLPGIVESEIEKLINIVEQCGTGLNFLLKNEFIEKVDVIEKGDYVTIQDHSWSILVTNAGMQNGNEYLTRNIPYKVVGFHPDLPTCTSHSWSEKENKKNNTIVMDDEGRVVFTQKRFLELED